MSDLKHFAAGEAGRERARLTYTKLLLTIKN
jgi:hypothetical protein